MKKHTIFICLILQLAMAFAQAPEKMSYQAVVRNNNNVLVSNHVVGMRISILQGSATGTAVYTETQTPTTNAIGLIAIEIGTGTLVTGTFANIDWANGPFFVKTETDPNGGTNYTLTGTNQLLSVPYALYAKSASNGIPAGGQNGQVLTICNGKAVWTNGGECPASITGFNCADTSHYGIIIANQALQDASTTTTIGYTGGNTGVFQSQTITSTGVTGLTANLEAGTLNNGNGTFRFTISGIANSSGIAGFTIHFADKTCTFYRTILSQAYFTNNNFYCNGTPTSVIAVTNPITGKTWMDRNLGAIQVANNSSDSAAFGDLYQWGRKTDGHQCRNSVNTNLLSTSDMPFHGNFITTLNSSYDWRSLQNNNLWQGINGVNNPCPSGYRLPTYSELGAELNSWSQNNSLGAFGSPLKLPMAGFRNHTDGSLNSEGSNGFYWSSTVNANNVWNLYFLSGNANLNDNPRAYGFSVRCIKD